MIGIAEHELDTEEQQGIGFDELRAALDKTKNPSRKTGSEFKLKKIAQKQQTMMLKTDFGEGNWFNKKANEDMKSTNQSA